MAWHNTDLARPDALYKDHFERTEERLQVAAHTTLGRHHPVPPITRSSGASATRAQRQQVTPPTAPDVESVARNAAAVTGPVPPITRAANDDELVLPPAQPIAYKGRGTPGTPGGASPRPSTIGSTPQQSFGAPPKGLALNAQAGEAYVDGGYTDAIARPGSAGSQALRQLDALHARMRLPAPRDVKPASSAEVTLARQHARTAGCERCESWLSGLASGAKGQGMLEQQARAQEARAQQQRRSTPPPRWPRGRS